MTNLPAIIIEDDQKLAVIFAEALRMAAFEPEIVRDGNNALARLLDVEPAVVVLDLHLPNVSGRDILAQIRADARLAKTPVIIATADPAMADRLWSDADLVLIKPISFGQLRDLAARLRPPGPET
ncbi:MAG: response regulator transcription factor [Anaerolineae bacterium]